jgi:GNAT superfamily N-acetyltransferase
VGDGAPVAIWLSKKRKPIQLGGRLYYRLDNIEVHPAHRGARVGRVLGVLLMGVIAQRALEVGASGIVLVTWESHISFYGRLGGRQEAPRGWTVAADLVPFVFDEVALTRLKEMADEFIAK